MRMVHQRAGMDELSMLDFIDLFTEIAQRSQPDLHPLGAIQQMLAKHAAAEE